MTAEPPFLAALAKPRISVVVCNYNYEHYIRTTLDSVVQQAYTPHEVIVVDDGSTDGSVNVIREYEARGIQVIVQVNGGQIAAYNTGFLQTTGDVVLFLDSDDALLPDALAEIATRFGRGVAKVHFKLDLIGPDDEAVGSSIPSGALACGDVSRDFLSLGVPHTSPPASGNAYRQSVLQRIFPLPEDPHDRHGADFFCIYGATLFGSVAACDRSLGLYRLHQAQENTNTFSFGNASKNLDLKNQLQLRLERFRPWIDERTNGSVKSPSTLLDFSSEKSTYAAGALAGRGRLSDLRTGLAGLPSLLKSIWIRRDFSSLKKWGLLAWAIIVLIGPRGAATKAAHYVCNPGSRHRRRSAGNA